MGIYPGNSEIKDIYLGPNKLKEAYLGSHKLWPMGKKMADFPLETIVKLKENGNWVNFKIINKGIPAFAGQGTISGNFATYDTSCDGIWLLRNEIESLLTSSSPTTYPNSSYAQYTNTTYFNKIDPEFRNIIKDVKIPYNNGKSNAADFVDGVNGYACKAFLLSITECGHLYSSDHKHGYDGAWLYPWLSYDTPSTNDTSKLIATYNGVANKWLTRTFEDKTKNYHYFLDTDGKWKVTTGATSSKPLGITPCIIVPNDILVNDSMEIVV